MWNCTVSLNSALDGVGSQCRFAPKKDTKGGCLGTRAGLDACGKSRFHRDSMSVAVPTELSRLLYSVEESDGSE
jgi:hypothetical protein